jgi:hypothetical protein
MAQEFAFEMWHEGKMVLEKGDTLKGHLKYDLQTDILQLQVNGKNESFTARKVLYFEIFDQTVKRYRQFYSLPFALNGAYKAPVFFELLEEGKITLLCREALEYRTVNSSFYFYPSAYTRLVLVYRYYLLEESGKINEFIDKKSNWLSLMGNRADEVEKFAKDNRLHFDDKEELIKIIAFYNSLNRK